MSDEPVEPRGWLSSVSELLSWSPSGSAPGKPLCLTCPPRRLRSGPQTLLCHDMMGGYLPTDLGPVPLSPDDDPPFTFVHWAYVDLFVYFSHHFVTLPPKGWLDAAHSSGTLVLGTLITEWEEGRALCEQLLASRQSAEAAAVQLARMAEELRFDGWLVNIENPVGPELVPRLEGFVRTLRDECRARLGPASRVVWYDSLVAPAGLLRWQNALNGLNEAFFAAADAIFLNYGWTEADVEASLEAASRLGEREADVFVGVDVFGRGSLTDSLLRRLARLLQWPRLESWASSSGCLGGGGWETRAALEVCRRHGASVALFAPGWVYETQDKRDFRANNARFWGLLGQHLPCRPVAGLPLQVDGFGDGRSKDSFSLAAQGSPQMHFLCRYNWASRLSASEDGALELRRGVEGRAGGAGEELRLFCLHSRLADAKLRVTLEASAMGGKVTFSIVGHRTRFEVGEKRSRVSALLRSPTSHLSVIVFWPEHASDACLRFHSLAVRRL